MCHVPGIRLAANRGRYQSRAVRPPSRLPLARKLGALEARQQRGTQGESPEARRLLLLEVVVARDEEHVTSVAEVGPEGQAFDLLGHVRPGQAEARFEH